MNVYYLFFIYVNYSASIIAMIPTFVKINFYDLPERLLFADSTFPYRCSQPAKV